MGLHDDMVATVDALYAAAAGQTDWQAAMDRVVDTMGFSHAMTLTACLLPPIDRVFAEPHSLG